MIVNVNVQLLHYSRYKVALLSLALRLLILIFTETNSTYLKDTLVTMLKAGSLSWEVLQKDSEVACN